MLNYADLNILLGYKKDIATSSSHNEYFRYPSMSTKHIIRIFSCAKNSDISDGGISNYWLYFLTQEIVPRYIVFSGFVECVNPRSFDLPYKVSIGAWLRVSIATVNTFGLTHTHQAYILLKRAWSEASLPQNSYSWRAWFAKWKPCGIWLSVTFHSAAETHHLTSLPNLDHRPMVVWTYSSCIAGETVEFSGSTRSSIRSSKICLVVRGHFVLMKDNWGKWCW